MKFHETSLSDAVLIELTPFEDHRGHFSRTFCAAEFGDAGLETVFVQSNASFNHKQGTLRGMHFQAAPHAEVKVVRCVSGAIHDIIIDLRPGSPSYLKWQGFDLTDSNGMQLYVPRGFAHGFVTLRDNTAVTYNVSTPYAPGAEGGLRWNDPAFAMVWPVEIAVISDKDAHWPDFDAAAHGRTA
jgi:dTDP-4-dehydrorhamnose 3,5-epimerase